MRLATKLRIELAKVTANAGQSGCEFPQVDRRLTLQNLPISPHFVKNQRFFCLHFFAVLSLQENLRRLVG